MRPSNLKLAISRERKQGDTRCSVAGTVKKLVGLGFEVVIESNVGEHPIPPVMFSRKTGANIVPTEDEALKCADLVSKVPPPLAEKLRLFNRSAMLAVVLNSHDDQDRIKEHVYMASMRL